MSTQIEEASGQVLVGGTEGLSLPPETVRRLAAGRLGGLILMGRNIGSAPQVRDLLASAARTAAPGWPAPLLGVDQEGGRVARLRADVLQLPPARRLGEIGDPGLTRRAHEALGRQLRALGFTTDFAPVLDVDDGPERGIVGDRAFSGRPEVAALHGVAALEGFLAAGLCPCGKHFPGHGCTERDSHHELPRVSLDRAGLEAKALGPFVAAFAAGLPMVMTAHVVYEALDENRPATCSASVVSGLLRRELGFGGAVVTDDLTMGAVAAAAGPEEVAVEAIAAGADLLLVCHDPDLQERVRAALAAAARKSPALAGRLRDAAGRARALRERFTPRAGAGDEAARALADSEAEAVAREIESRLA